MRPHGCPWAALSNPYVVEVIRARKWWENGAIDARYPNGVPAAIAEGIDIYDAALNAVQVNDSREDREEREREARERAEQRQR